MMLQKHHSGEAKSTEINRREVLKASGAGIIAPQLLDDLNTNTINENLFVEIGITHSLSEEVNLPHIDQISTHSFSADKNTLILRTLDTDTRELFRRHRNIAKGGEYRHIPGQMYGRNTSRAIYVNTNRRRDPTDVLPVISTYVLPLIQLSMGAESNSVEITVEGENHTISPKSAIEIQLGFREAKVAAEYLNNVETEDNIQTITVRPKLSIENFGEVATKVITNG